MLFLIRSNIFLFIQYILGKTAKILISIMKLYTMCLSTKGELQIMEKIMKKNKKFVFLVSLTAIVTTLTSLIAPIIIQYLTNKKTLIHRQ